MRFTEWFPALQPLRRKLPLLIAGLIALAIATFGLLANRQLRIAFEAMATDRLHVAAQRLGSLLAEQTGLIRNQLASQAGDPILVASLTNPTPQTVAAAESLLTKQLPPLQAPSRALFTKDCRLVASGGQMKESALLKTCPANSPLVSLKGAGRQAWVQPFVIRGDTVLYAVIAPVVKGTDTLGTLVQVRTITSRTGGRVISALIGRDVTFMLGNAKGPRVWTDLSTPTSGPDRARVFGAAPAYYEPAGGVEQMGVALRIAATPWFVWVQVPVATARAGQYRALQQMFGIGIAIILIGLVFAIVIGNHVTGPLLELSSAADDLASGDYGRRVGTTRKDEIGLLMTSFNRMGEEVEAAKHEMAAQGEELEQHYRDAQDMAHELEISNQELLEAAEEARMANAGRELAQSQLLHVQKMDAVGRLAGGVAHDFNNLLTVISSYTELALEGLDAKDALYQDMLEIRSSTDRAARLTRQLLAFSRKQVLQIETVRLNAVASEMEKMLHRLIGEDVALVFDLARDLGEVRADPGQLEQVLMNLVLNARDAMPNGGRLVVRTANVTVANEILRDGQSVPPGDYVTLSVVDTGSGMTRETRDHLFEPFFTTKEQGQGTGLGLSIVYGVVKQFSGEILVDSEPEHGTTFDIYLPRLPHSNGDYTTGRRTSGPARIGSETILLVEDDTSLRSLARRILSDAGYAVIEATTASEAIAIGESYRDRIHLLLTDVVMPQASGSEVGARLSATRQGLRVLYMSGYTDDDVLRRGVVQEKIDFLQKPFTPAQLTKRVREVLDAAD